MRMSKSKKRFIPVKNSIVLFFHCRNCFYNKPSGINPREYAQIETGFTKLGIQVWCKRCDLNIIHVDFQGKKHPANLESEFGCYPHTPPSDSGKSRLNANEGH